MQRQHGLHHGMRRRPVTFFLGLAVAGFFVAPAHAGDVTVSNATAHVMEDSVNGRRIEVYMTIDNAGAARDRLYAVRSKLSRNTMLSVVQHASDRASGGGHANMTGTATGMHMQTRVLDVPAAATAVLEHGGSHIMLMGPTEMPAVGATFPVTLFFERAGRMSVEVTVVPAEMSH